MIDKSVTTLKEKETPTISLLKEFIYLLWDGIHFFSYNDNKLNRLRKGQEDKWYDRFRNKRWVLFKIVIISVAVAIFLSQY